MSQSSVFQEKYYTSQDGLKLYYRDYNPQNSDKTPLLCLHGLTRNSKDYDKFARHFSAERRIISLDIRGRGMSDFDPDHMNYQIPTYAQDVLTFLEHEGLDKVISIGTSMGGLISMAVGLIKPEVFKGIILNDIGPEIDPRGLKRISAYVGTGTVLQNWHKAVEAVKKVSHFLFPDYDQADWETFTRNSFRQRDDGTIVADYDQQITTAIRQNAEYAVPIDLWPMFSALGQIPLLTLRGENSDILSRETLERMAREHPKFTPVIVPNRAHTPDLCEDISLREIRNFIGNL